MRYTLRDDARSSASLRVPVRPLAGALGAALELVAIPAFARLSNAKSAKPHALPDPPLFRPLGARRRYGVVHYNVVIPDLPEPHRFFACMVIMGQAGIRVFDADHAVVGTPRDTATVATGTGATAPESFRSHSISRDCELHDDGSLLKFGEQLEIRGSFPNFTVEARAPQFALDVELACTDEITWFMRSPLYEHVGIPARYSGSLRWRGKRRQVSGLCSFEHAQAVTATSLLGRPVPARLKLPVGLFVYQVLKLDEDTLLLLTYILAAGRPLLASAFVKEIDGEQSCWFDEVECELLEPRGEPLVAPDGRRTSLPAAYRWSFGDPERDGLALELTPDTPSIYGVGSGWMGGASYEGRFRGADIAGTAYYEHVDRMSSS